MIELVVEPDKDGHAQFFIQELDTLNKWLLAIVTSQTDEAKVRRLYAILNTEDNLQSLYWLKEKTFYRRDGDSHNFRPKYPLLRSLREQRTCKDQLRQIEAILDKACKEAGIKDT